MKLQLVVSTLFALLAMVPLLSAEPVQRTPAAAAQGPSVEQPQVVAAVAHDTSVPLRSMSPLPSAAAPGAATPVVPEPRRTRPLGRVPGLAAAAAGAAAAASRDPVAQGQPRAAAAPAASRGFDGLTAADDGTVSGSIFAPSDANGDVGPGHYIQIVNNLFAIYDKNGNKLFPPGAPGARLSSLFAGFGGLCATHDDGDPIVLYDAQADRWLLSQFALGNSAPFLECIAISATADPLGAYHRYAFPFSKVPDYPKLGVWPDAYYMSANQFDATFTNFLGAGAVAFDRALMLAGLSATMVYFDLCPTNVNCVDAGLLPADLDGTTPPPAGTPNTFVEFQSVVFGSPADALKLFDFHADFVTPANSTFTVAGTLPTAPFNPIVCADPGGQCIPQPGFAERLDAISDRLMYRLAYRNLGARQALVVNHTVNAGGGQAGIRWYELSKVGVAPYVILQQGTYAGDGANTLHRWMGSIAMDRDGNIALGYSTSGSAAFPSIRYTGRLATDPPGTLPQGETTLFAGTGSQINTQSRWGDYSAMAVDPSDDCTFWYTNQYYATTSSFNWRTRIGAFNFPSCPSNLPPLPTSTSTPTPTITPTPTTTGTPTATPTITSTPTITPTPTSTGTPTTTLTPTSTSVPTQTPTPPRTPTPSPCILGDINCDGIVDIRDYAIWRQQFGATNCGNRADLNGDCIVDIRDYGIWRQNFGHTAASHALRAAPPVAQPIGTARPRSE